MRRFVVLMCAVSMTVAAGLGLSAQSRPVRGGELQANPHDAFYFLTMMNKPSVVMLAETGIVPAPLASKIAKGIQQVDGDEAKPGAKRPGDYPVFEEELLAAAGPEASRLHTGRSRQDLGSTSARLALREGLLDTFERLRM